MQSPPSPPPLAQLVGALSVLGMSDSDLRAFEAASHADLAWDFTEAVAGSPSAIVTDWKFSPGDVLLEVFLRLYPFGIKAMVEAEDEETLHPKTILIRQGEVGARYRVRIPEEPCLDDVLFSLQSILPETVRIYSLARFEETDTYGHVLLPRETWTRVEELLGPWFGVVFAEHRVKPLFKRVGKDVKPKRNFLKTRLKNAAEWLRRTREHFDGMVQIDLERMTKGVPFDPSTAAGLEESLVEMRRQRWETFWCTPTRLCALNMSLWAKRVGAEGALELWRRKEAGWTKLRRSLQYFYWNVVAQVRFAKCPGFGLGDFGNQLALAIMLDEWQIAAYLAGVMVREEGFHRSPLTRFLVRLFSFHNPATSVCDAVPESGFGVYGQIVSCWEKPETLRGPLELACDYHMMRIGEDHEFYGVPFDLLAAEVLAVYRVRHQLGLNTPRVDHQLLDAPWADLPSRIPLESDSFLDRFAQVVSQEAPEMLPEMSR